jgi:hypothetical protein
MSEPHKKFLPSLLLSMVLGLFIQLTYSSEQQPDSNVGKSAQPNEKVPSILGARTFKPGMTRGPEVRVLLGQAITTSTITGIKSMNARKWSFGEFTM